MTFEYSLLFDIDQYAGNHQRGLCSYIFGTCDEHAQSNYFDICDEWLSSVSEDERLMIDDFIDIRPVDEYGLMPYAIEWYDGKPNTIEIFVVEKPYDKILDFIQSRLNENNSFTYKGIMGDETVKVLSIRMREKQIKVIDSVYYLPEM